jgi:hypothetical protein
MPITFEQFNSEVTKFSERYLFSNKFNATTNNYLNCYETKIGNLTIAYYQSQNEYPWCLTVYNPYLEVDAIGETIESAYKVLFGLDND